MAVKFRQLQCDGAWNFRRLTRFNGQGFVWPTKIHAIEIVAGIDAPANVFSLRQCFRAATAGQAKHTVFNCSDLGFLHRHFFNAAHLEHSQCTFKFQRGRHFTRFQL